MAISQRLDLRQSQSLVMTPQLQQAIKLLQMSNLELSTHVEEQLEQNPLLERGEASAEGEAPALDAGEAASAPGDDSRTNDSGDNDSSEAEEYDSPDYSDEGGYGDTGGPGEDWGSPRGSEGGGLEQTASQAASLRDHLLEQVNVDLADPVDRLIAVHLLDTLDESGYVASDLSQITTLLGCTAERVDTALEKLQGFDPTGIFARNLAECLTLQLRDRNRLTPAMEKLLAHLDLLARHDMKALMKACGIDQKTLSEMIAEIRTLNPKPAQAFDSVAAQPVTPDVLMRAKRGGGWHIELNNATLPRVLVNNRYYTEVLSHARTKDEKSYISEQLQSANWLVRAMNQRAQTILKVAEEIVRQQDAFFTKGVQHLRPLTLRHIAEKLEMHESTVSRVTSNKFLETPRGVYELKYFFTSSIAATGGQESHSAESVRHRIKTLIDGEAPDNILSDDRIVEILREDGIDIARRTVAKYREAMKIGSSIQRRRSKSAFA